ncbi:helix-turn-helix domain-containing protein [Nocardia takedensis]|uniref:helix-turn-helix domain-containing protein n=1 Tax=Nocardia takedensis TaxID=259390 RepID=UPI000300D4ED|nr:helix-turn-helix transcriptional regulator [Nocardia takedensis]
MAEKPEVSAEYTGHPSDPSDGAGERGGRVATAAHDIGGFIRSQREAAQVSLRQLAALAGVSNPYLSQIERGLRNPSAEVLAQIAKALRVSSEVLYVRAGYLEQRPHSPIRDALLADTEISERQKQVLLEIYESFRRENGGSEPVHGGLRATAPGAEEPQWDSDVPRTTTDTPLRQENEE